MKNGKLIMQKFRGLVYAYIHFWNIKENDFSPVLLLIDTGASVTTISVDIIQKLGYDVAGGKLDYITTASGIEPVRAVNINKIVIDRFEFNDIKVYAHTFPEESLSSGVLGLDILSQFDVNLLFSKQLIELHPIHI
jgi:clan AA aspartic protease (TIGR02281 family)